jgi:hypothetical protein
MKALGIFIAAAIWVATVIPIPLLKQSAAAVLREKAEQAINILHMQQIEMHLRPTTLCQAWRYRDIEGTAL